REPKRTTARLGFHSLRSPLALPPNPSDDPRRGGHPSMAAEAPP
uniref:Uncharacterized protein n=1 Tax=Aegilops tauschii subsp. strangulata TaxID=200361 RepID=A0A453DNL6_AEGTS